MMNTDGRKISVPQRGLNIVKLSDGSTIKILIEKNETRCVCINWGLQKFGVINI